MSYQQEIVRVYFILACLVQFLQSFLVIIYSSSVCSAFRSFQFQFLWSFSRQFGFLSGSLSRT